MNKGIDLITNTIKYLLLADVQFIILGTGNEKYEQFFRSLQKEYTQRFL